MSGGMAFCRLGCDVEGRTVGCMLVLSGVGYVVLFMYSLNGLGLFATLSSVGFRSLSPVDCSGLRLKMTRWPPHASHFKEHKLETIACVDSQRWATEATNQGPAYRTTLFESKIYYTTATPCSTRSKPSEPSSSSAGKSIRSRSDNFGTPSRRSSSLWRKYVIPTSPFSACRT